MIKWMIEETIPYLGSPSSLAIMESFKVIGELGL